MRRLAAATAIIVMPVVTSWASVPPPPARFIASNDAIRELAPFIGEWHGVETQHIKGSGEYKPHVYWRITQLGERDVILLEHGYGSKTPPSGRESDKAYADLFDVLTFSPNENKYKMYLPGYRPFKGSESTGQLVVADHPDAHTLSWFSFMGDGGHRRTILSIVDGKMIETLDVIRPNAATSHLSDAELQKEGTNLATAQP